MDQMPSPSDLIAQSTTHVSLLAMASNAYQEAKEGGEYSKHYERYKDEYTARLNRARPNPISGSFASIGHG
jgi:hypothetical protein